MIRRATFKDFTRLYNLGRRTPELRVSAVEPFMHENEFERALESRGSIFLLAEENKKLLGFVYINTRDVETPGKYNEACLVYLVVDKNARGRGVATQLYNAAVPLLKKKGITHLYAWASPKNKGATVSFMKKQGFTQGSAYVWMDRKI